MSQTPPDNQPQQSQYQPQQQYPPQPPNPYPPQYAPVPPKKRNNCLMYALIAIGVVIVLAVLASLVNKPTTTVSSTTPGVAAPTAAAVVPTAPAYKDIAAQKAALTAAQLDTYAKGLAGARITNWTGTTLDVAPKPFSSTVYQIQVDMTGPTDNPLKNAQVYVDIPKADAQNISKGKAITFSGTVDHIDCTFICTVEVKDATYTVK